jgi:hypothetical protein
LNSDSDPYQAPKANLIEVIDPAALWVVRPKAKSFVVAAWCTLVSALLIVVGLGIGEAVDSFNDTDLRLISMASSTVSLVLGVVSLHWLKRLLRGRLAHNRSDWILNTMIGISVLTLPVVPFIYSATSPLAWPYLYYYAVSLGIGVLSMMLGVRLLRNPVQMNYLKLLGWLELVAGALFASVFLAPVGSIVGMLGSITLTVMFFDAAKELRQLNGTPDPGEASGHA